jgi:hypothetical protein
MNSVSVQVGVLERLPGRSQVCCDSMYAAEEPLLISSVSTHPIPN